MGYSSHKIKESVSISLSQLRHAHHALECVCALHDSMLAPAIPIRIEINRIASQSSCGVQCHLWDR